MASTVHTCTHRACTCTCRECTCIGIDEIVNWMKVLNHMAESKCCKDVSVPENEQKLPTKYPQGPLSKQLPSCKR